MSFAAARIELLGIVHYDTCTAVNARIIQCWEIKGQTCPPANTSLTIPTCTGCPILQPLIVGDHYLIAGVHYKINGIRRIVLPSRGQTGLFSHWDDDRYENITHWIQHGIHCKYYSQDLCTKIISLSFPCHEYIAIQLLFDEEGYTVSEEEEYLEVCIKLASTGSHEELLSSVEVNISFEDQSATGTICHGSFPLTIQCTL